MGKPVGVTLFDPFIEIKFIIRKKSERSGLAEKTTIYASERRRINVEIEWTSDESFGFSIPLESADSELENCKITNRVSNLAVIILHAIHESVTLRKMSLNPTELGIKRYEIAVF
jgi:hypothetical protein